MALGERKRMILKAVVDDYIKNAEPVGSKALSQNLGLKLSSATIRNEMSELENLGFLEQPHTSAGRVPSNLGYRFYVDELMNAHALSLREMEAINRSLRVKVRELDALMAEAGRLISSLTDYAAYTTVTHSAYNLRRVDLIPVDRETFVIVLLFSANIIKNTIAKKSPEISNEKLYAVAAILNGKLLSSKAREILETNPGEIAAACGVPESFVSMILAYIVEIADQLSHSQVFVGGTERILAQPEFSDVLKARKLLEYLGDRESLSRLPAPDRNQGMKILIGPENVNNELNESSVIVASYEIGDGMKGLVGVVGPTRMDYSKVSAKLGYFTERLSRLLQQEHEEENGSED